MHRRGRSRRPGHRNGLKPKQGAAPNCGAFFVYLGIAMPVIESRINSRSQAFIDNARALQEQVDDLRAKLLSAAKGDRKEHTSELQSLMRISYAVFCLKKKKIIK